MLNLQQFQDCGAIIGNRYVLKNFLLTTIVVNYLFSTPTSSTSILSKPTGPKEDLTTFAMATAAITEIEKF
jgi:hypothetical protein